MRIPLAAPSVGSNAIAYLAECVENSTVSTHGPFIGRFERAFADFVGVEDAMACVSGTAAIHLALLAAGVGAGDEVWVSDLTFIASANPVVYCAASVTFVDSEPDSWNIDPALVVHELGRRAQAGERLPKAIIPVDMVGHPADMAG